ncbi:hypothetical protein M514_09738 [Trichuris suis]|uniref:Uncharacterized protein n=1 Tax=Trichuris suis TaxID=68888 RepID=A0A085N512_9BILA|nr:hypothetical protein M513_09738 [Trichuris suis]KFD64558.1 hypothetical protein M514_09738 [Trichuris suis]
MNRWKCSSKGWKKSTARALKGYTSRRSIGKRATANTWLQVWWLKTSLRANDCNDQRRSTRQNDACGPNERGTLASEKRQMSKRRPIMPEGTVPTEAGNKSTKLPTSHRLGNIACGRPVRQKPNPTTLYATRNPTVGRKNPAKFCDFQVHTYSCLRPRLTFALLVAK